MDRSSASSSGEHGGARRAVGRLVSVRAGEGRTIAAVAAAFAALEAGRGLGETGIRAVVLDQFGKDVLPVLFIALGAVGILATTALGAFLGPGRAARAVVVVPSAGAVVLLAGHVAAARGGPLLTQGLWVAVHLVGLLVLTLLWASAARVFDARQAKRLFPLCEGAAIAGYFAGTLSAGTAARLIGASNLVLLQVVLLALVGVAVARVRTQLRSDIRGSASGLSVIGDGARYVARSPLMRLVALAYLLFAVLLFAMWYPFLGIMEESFPGDAELASALGLVAAAATAISVPVAALLAKRLYLRFGVATMALVLPAMYVGGFAIWLVAFALPVAVGVRLTQEVVQRGVTNSAWSAMFSVVPRARRGPVLAFMDAVPGHAGTIISGALLAVAASLATTAVFAMGLTVALACFAVCVAIRRRYGATVLATLREGVAEQVLEGGPGIAALTRDRGVTAGLAQAAASPDATQRRMVAEVYGAIGGPDAGRALAPLLEDDDPQVRLAALEALARAGSAPPGPLEPLLSDPEPAIRGRAVALLGRRRPALVAPLSKDADPGVRAQVAVAWSGTVEDPQGWQILELLLAGSNEELLAGLRALAVTPWPVGGLDVATLAASHEPLVRAAAIRVLARDVPQVQPQSLVPAGSGATYAQVLHGALADDAAAVREAAAAALRVTPWGQDVALSALRAPSARTRTAALAALDPDLPATRTQVVAWALGEVHRAEQLRRDGRVLAAAARGDPPPRAGEAHDGAAAGEPRAAARASAAFLAALLSTRAERIVGHGLAVVGLLRGGEGSGPIRRALSSPDPEDRAHAIEALESLGAGRLARDLARTLDESEQQRSVVSADRIPEVARRYVGDPDPWVRALSLRTLADYLHQARQEVLRRAATDTSPEVAATFAGVGQREDDVAQTAPGVLDRMLTLRSVPLFAALEPEDLHRMATHATERVYVGGDDLVREGDVGDELFVVVGGVVHVVRAGETGEQVVREIGQGEHVGELAVLRPGPRTATVRAGEPAVRVLVLRGEAVMAVLRERPEAALAMLATLADRIGAT